MHDVTYSWMFPWPTPLTVKNVYEREPNNYKVQIRTLVFLHSGQDTITAGGIDKGITIISNPFSIILPDHICPQGTQITTSEVSSFFSKSFSVSGVDPTAKISESGLLTYDPTKHGTLKIKASISYNNKAVAIAEKDITIGAHDLHGYLYPNNYEYTRRDLENNNYIPANNTITVHFGMDFTEFSYELLKTSGVPEVNYSRNNLVFHNMSMPAGYVIPFKFTYKLAGCKEPTIQYVNFIVLDEDDYLVGPSYPTVYINRINTNQVRLTKNAKNDKYTIIEASTGIIKKEGYLNSEKNEINISNLSKGLYIVRIQTPNKTENHKIFIN